jgi:aminomethyltransferase
MIDQTLDTCMIAIQGPKAVSLCAGMFEADPSQLKYYYASPTRYKTKPCVVSRTGYTGEDGLEVMIGKAQAVEIWDDFIKRGAKPCGLGARDTLRLEAAMPLYGHELSETLNPLQAGLSWAVKLEKGEFVGRAALEKSKAKSAPVRVGFTVEGKRSAREGSLVLSNGKEIGKVTSGAFAPTLQCQIAMAYVPAEFALVGTKLQVDIRGDKADAHVVKLPFYQRPKP